MGWKRRRIGALVLLESAIAGIVASTLGIGLGLTAAVFWAQFQGWETRPRRLATSRRDRRRT